jgi:hypothetical protein
MSSDNEPETEADTVTEMVATQKKTQMQLMAEAQERVQENQREGRLPWDGVSDEAKLALRDYNQRKGVFAARPVVIEGEGATFQDGDMSVFMMQALPRKTITKDKARGKASGSRYSDDEKVTDMETDLVENEVAMDMDEMPATEEDAKLLPTAVIESKITKFRLAVKDAQKAMESELADLDKHAGSCLKEGAEKCIDDIKDRKSFMDILSEVPTDRLLELQAILPQMEANKNSREFWKVMNRITHEELLDQEKASKKAWEKVIELRKITNQAAYFETFGVSIGTVALKRELQKLINQRGAQELADKEKQQQKSKKKGWFSS